MAGVDTGNVDSPSDFGSNPQGVAARWISEIELAEKDHTKWRNASKKVIRKYRAERGDAPGGEKRSRRFSLFWSNMETLGPAIYARVPQAVVGRRWKDADDLGRLASEVLERALNFTLDSGDFLDTMRGVRNEYLLTGRGMAWVRYVPHMQTVEPDPAPVEGGEENASLDASGEVAEGVEPYETVAWEEITFDHVSWDDFLHNPARKWAEVRWVCRVAYLTRDELVARFGAELGAKIPLDHDDGKRGSTDDQWAKAAIYEIWDKPSRKAIWVSKSYPEGTLDERDDPLSLKDFFPCPRPVLGTCAPDSILPIPDFTYYDDQLRDIDVLTTRIGMLTDALKLRGFYAAGGETKTNLSDLMSAETNVMVPIDSWAAFADKGGVKGLIEWLPLDMVGEALRGCVEARRQLIADVYQVTGIADIMRGDVDPDETATATRTKSNWGSLRVRDKQKELARFTRSLLRIGAEIIATKFMPETLSGMSNVQLLPTVEAKQALQAQIQAMAQQSALAAQQAQTAGVAPPPPFQPSPDEVQQLQRPTWEELDGLLRNNVLRGFRIDVETDSTIEPNDQDEKQRRIEFVQAVGEYVSRTMPVIQLMPAMTPVIVQGLLFLVRGFRVGREMEEVIEQALDKLQSTPPPQEQGKPGPNPQVEAAKAQADTTRANASMLSAQADMTRAHVDQFRAQSGAKLDGQKIAAEDQRTAADRASEQSMHSSGLAADMQQAILKATERSLVRDVNDRRPITAPTQ